MHSANRCVHEYLKLLTNRDCEAAAVVLRVVYRERVFLAVALSFRAEVSARRKMGGRSLISPENAQSISRYVPCFAWSREVVLRVGSQGFELRAQSRARQATLGIGGRRCDPKVRPEGRA